MEVPPLPSPASLLTDALASLSLPALSVAFVLPLLASSRSNTRIEYTVTTVTTLTSRCGKMWGRSTLPLTTPTTTTTAHHRSCPSPPSGGKGKVHARQTTQVIRPARIGQLLEDGCRRRKARESTPRGSRGSIPGGVEIRETGGRRGKEGEGGRDDGGWGRDRNVLLGPQGCALVARCSSSCERGWTALRCHSPPRQVTSTYS